MGTADKDGLVGLHGLPFVLVLSWSILRPPILDDGKSVVQPRQLLFRLLFKR